MPFKIVRNDLTKMKVDAVVNTANPLVGYGAGTDEAIYRAAGTGELLAARENIGKINPGEAYITPGFNLPASYIIHTVGPVWEGGSAGERDVLKQCYVNSLNIALMHNFESIAFPLISSGTYAFPKTEALGIPLSVFSEFLENSDMDIYLVVYDRESVRVSERLFPDMDSYIDDKYVSEKGSFLFRGANMAPSPMYRRSRQDIPLPSASIPAPPAEDRDENFCASAPKPVTSESAPKPVTCENASEPIGCESVSLYSAEPLVLPKRSLDDVIGNLQKSFMEMVFSFADERGITDLEVRKRANLDKKTFSKLKCGNTKNPSKATALAIAIALRLNLDETKDLLARAGMALSPCSRFDLIVQYFIEREVYDIFTINIALFEHGEQILGSQAVD